MTRADPSSESSTIDLDRRIFGALPVLRGEALELDEDVLLIDQEHALAMHDERYEDFVDRGGVRREREADP